MARRIGSRIWEGLASLRLAIACLGGLMVLVAGCTVAQVELGTWRAVEITMRSWLVWWELPRSGLRVPIFPGGIPLGLLLAASLIAAQVSRLERAARKAGIWLAHAGLILLVAGEFVSAAFQRDLRMAVEVGETRAYLEDPRQLELVLADSTDPGFDEEWAVPEPLLAAAGAAPIALPGSPVALRVKRYHANAELRLRAAGDPAPLATDGVGRAVAVAARPPITADGERNRAAAWVEPVAGGRGLGVWLVSNALRPVQAFEHAGRSYRVWMRPRREVLPFALTLKAFRHERYPGTDIPRSFSSLVHLSNPSTGEERDVLISMNQPLRYAGRAFYQQSFGKDDTLSILQVVRNPGWLLPYLAVALVTAGLLLHFALALRRAGATAAAARAKVPAPRRALAAAARRRKRPAAAGPAQPAQPPTR